MEFEPLEEAGTLRIEYDGPTVDLGTLAIVQFNLQAIVDAVADQIVYDSRSVRRHYRYFDFPLIYGPPPRLHGRMNRPLRANIRSIESGSLYEEIAFVLASVLSQENYRAVFQGLSANILYAISRSGVVKFFPTTETKNLPDALESNDQFDVGPNVSDMIVALAENAGSKPSKLRIKSTDREGGTVEITAEINPKRRR